MTENGRDNFSKVSKVTRNLPISSDYGISKSMRFFQDEFKTRSKSMCVCFS